MQLLVGEKRSTVCKICIRNSPFTSENSQYKVYIDRNQLRLSSLLFPPHHLLRNICNKSYMMYLRKCTKQKKNDDGT